AHPAVARRHDSEHGVTASVEAQGLANDVGIRLKAIAPQVVTQDGHRGSADSIFFRGIRAPEKRMNLVVSEIVGGNLRYPNVIDARLLRQAHAGGFALGGDGGQATGAGANVEKLRHGKQPAVHFLARKAGAQQDYAIAVLVDKGMKECSVDDGVERD